jgi:hypothetical protein
MSETNNNIKQININLTSGLNSMYNFMNNMVINSTVLSILVIVMLAIIVVRVLFGATDSSSVNVDSSSSNWLLSLVITIFIILLLISAIQYFFNVDIVKTIKDLITLEKVPDFVKDIQKASGSPITSDTGRVEDTSTTRVDAIKAPIPELLLRKQVFNIPENTYVYEDAKALCSAYGSRLATYQEVEDAYKNGADWCNYGWSDNQMALFPTQQSKYDQLQKIKGHENDCGRPGVNGGFIANPEMRFGVNCYGYKPRMTPQEEELMATQPVYPKTEKDLALEQRVKFWKDRLKSILVSPFNHNTWSKL